MNIVIVSTSCKRLEDFWQQKLQPIVAKLDSKDNLAIAVSEDWEGGAGNGLGTLYAYTKAREKARDLYNIDIFEKQKQGASIAIYHTAGQGKRLFPLTASEYNDKSSVKLPSNIYNGSRLSVLEAIILQTHQYVKRSKGRLSVYWTDQFFFPFNEYPEPQNNHINIYVKNIEQPDASSFEKLKLSNYGLIARLKSNRLKLLEKLDFATFSKMNESPLFRNSSWSISLGSFNLSCLMTFALLQEFEHEIKTKSCKLDSDYHFWMPFSLDSHTYTSILSKQGYDPDFILKHYDRMNSFKNKFCRLHSADNFFGVLDIGSKGFWWDFGSVESYFDNLMKLASSDNFEGKIMRLFLNIDNRPNLSNIGRIVKDESSILIDCNIRSGVIKNSILVGVNAKTVDLQNTIIINGNFSTLKAEESLFYNVKESNELSFDHDTVRSDVFLTNPDEQIKLYSQKKRDGKLDWPIALPGNTISYRDLFDKIDQNQEAAAYCKDS